MKRYTDLIKLIVGGKMIKNLSLALALLSLASCGANMDDSKNNGEPDGSHASAEWQIWAYSTAAPDFIGDFATVKDGNGKVLREGSNSWVCLAFNLCVGLSLP